MIFDSSPILNHRISSGTQASDGTARMAPSVGASRMSPRRRGPTTAPKARPIAAPNAKPMSTRCVEMAMYCPSRPRWARSTAASHTISGDGSCDTGTRPLVDTNCQTSSSATGMIAPPTTMNHRRRVRGPDAAASSRPPRAGGATTEAPERPATIVAPSDVRAVAPVVSTSGSAAASVSVMVSPGGSAEAAGVGLRHELVVDEGVERLVDLLLGRRRRRARRRSGRSSRAPRPARRRAPGRRRGWSAR